MLDAYAKNRQLVTEGLVRLEEAAESPNVKAASSALREKLVANEFSLVVVGQFKRGKTTFINALLGRDLLPVAIIPLTSIITIIGYGEELRIKVFFNDGSGKEIKPEDLSLYVTEKHNPKNKRGVDRVEVSFPSPYLKNGVRIIDTPGVASVHEHNTRITYDYLPRADAAIFLMGVDPPLTKAELNFLRDLKKIVSRMFFVQNKIDSINAVDRRESLEFSKKIIMEDAGFGDIAIFPLSAKEALEAKKNGDKRKLEESGLAEFERSLERFLLEEKGNVLVKSTIAKMDSLVNEELFIAGIERKSLQMPVSELEEKISAFRKFMIESEQEKKDSLRLFSEEIRELENGTLVEDLEKLKKEETARIVAWILEFSSAHKADGNAKFAELMNDLIAKQIMDLFAVWRVKEEKALNDELKVILGRFADRMDEVLGNITRFSAELFGIAGVSVRVKGILPPEIEFRVGISDERGMLGLTLDLAKKALPKVLAHKLIAREARKKAEEMLDGFCGKARYDFSRRLDQLVRNYRQDITGIVEEAQKNVLQALETALAAKSETVSLAAARAKKIEARIAVLEEIKVSLGGIM